jgi:hypothetical protein
MSKATRTHIEVPREFEAVADCGYYMISAALDIMESTFGDRKLARGNHRQEKHRVRDSRADRYDYVPIV